MTRPSRSPLSRYGVAIAATGLAVLLALLADRGQTQWDPFPLILVAALVSSWYGGLGPGLLTVVAGGVLMYYLFIPPRGTWDVGNAEVAEEFAVWVLVAVLVSVLSARRRRAEARVHDYAERLDALGAASRAYAEALPEGQGLLDLVAQRVATTFSDGCVIRLLAPGEQRLEVVAFDHAIPEARSALQRLIAAEAPGVTGGIANDVLREGHATIIGKTAPREVSAAAMPGYEQYVEQFGIHSVLAAPMRTRNTTIGTLVAWRDRNEQPFTLEDQDFMQDLADRAALAIRNAQLFEQAQAAEARYRNLFNGAADAIAILDEGGHFVDVNPATTTMLGYSAEELRATRLGAGMVAANGRDWAQAMWEHIRDEGSWHGEFDLLRKDGAVVPVEASVSGILLPTGMTFFATWHDISERRSLEQQRQDFVAMVSHDLRNPLAAVLGYAQLLQRRGGYGAKTVEAIVEQAERMSRLIAELAEVVGLDAGQLTLRPSRLDLVALVRQGVEQAQMSAPTHRLRVETGVSTLAGSWDADRLAQILHNLLGNAVKYSPDGGEVVVQVTDLGDAAQICVSDHGLGIPAEALPRLFDRYFRVAETAHRAPGLGLGLYISRVLVEAHGGRIWAESTPGEGSTIGFTLPYERDGGGP